MESSPNTEDRVRTVIDRRESRSSRALRAAVLLSAAIAASCSGPVQRTRGERSCDRNGDYEERMACSP